MRILCIITTGFVTGGGLTAVMMNYYRCLWEKKKCENDMEICFMSQNKLSENLKNEISMHGSKYFKLPSRKSNPIGHYREMHNILEKNSFDVLHLNCNSATGAFDLLVAKKYVPNRIVHIHNSSTQYPLVHKLMLPIFRKSYTKAVAVSKTAGDWIFGEFPFSILNNAIDTRKFEYNQIERLNMRRKYNISDDTYLIGHVGKMHTDQKNQEFLIQIFPEIKKNISNAKLLFVGDGKNLTGHKQLASLLGCETDVIFAGFQTNINEYMQMFDLFCFPSRFEGLGMVTIEAQAAGLQCIVSASVPEEVAVTDKVKFIGIEEKDKKSWVKEIVTCRANTTQRENTKEIIHEQIKKNGFDIEVECEKLLDLYEYQ